MRQITALWAPRAAPSHDKNDLDLGASPVKQGGRFFHEVF